MAARVGFVVCLETRRGAEGGEIGAEPLSLGLLGAVIGWGVIGPSSPSAPQRAMTGADSSWPVPANFSCGSTAGQKVMLNLAEIPALFHDVFGLFCLTRGSLSTCGCVISVRDSPLFSSNKHTRGHSFTGSETHLKSTANFIPFPTLTLGSNPTCLINTSSISHPIPSTPPLT